MMYYKARKYCYSLVGTDYGDLLHDSYLQWWDKCQKNLFEEHERTVMAVIKYLFRQRLNLGKRMINGEIIKTQKLLIEDFEPTTVDHYQADLNVTFTSISRKLYPSTDPLKLLKIADLRWQGYDGKEIGRMMGVSTNAISKQVLKIKDICENLR